MTDKLQPQHANVVRVLAAESSPSALFVVMELCHFGLDQQPTDFQDYLHSVDEYTSPDSMAAFLAEGHMVLNALVQDLLRGTAFLHSKKVCHCDIKPANVLCAFDRKGKHRPYRREFFQQAQLKLTDFGTFVWRRSEFRGCYAARFGWASPRWRPAFLHTGQCAGVAHHVFVVVGVSKVVRSQRGTDDSWTTATVSAAGMMDHAAGVAGTESCVVPVQHALV